MIDIQLIRDDIEGVYNNLVLKCANLAETVRLEHLLLEVASLDRIYRDTKQTAESLQQDMNIAAKQFSKLTPEERERQKEYLAWLKGEIAVLVERHKDEEKKLKSKLLEVPNLCYPSVPVINGTKVSDYL